MNLNLLAEQIAAREGGKVNCSIAQVKECLRHALDLLALTDPLDVMRLLQKRRKAMRKKRGGKLNPRWP